MFVIPCKYIENQTNIFELINSIKKYQPYEKVLIADSNSQNLDYTLKLKEINKNIVVVENNKHRIDSAIWTAYNDFKDEDFFYILHDSMVLTNSLEKFSKNNFTCYSYFECNGLSGWGGYPEHMKYVKESLEAKTKFKMLNEFFGIFGTTFLTNRDILNKLHAGGLNNVLPNNKSECQASERKWGICLKQVGVDVSENSIVPDINGVFYQTDTNYIKKHFYGR